MAIDEVMEELYEIKRQLAEEAGYDVRVAFRQMREYAAKHPHRLADPPIPVRWTPKPSELDEKN